MDALRYVNSEDTVPTIGDQNLNAQFASTKGEMEYRQNNNWKLGEEDESILRAFEYIGEARSFTINKGSVSDHHNMSETYRQGIGMIRD